MVRRPPARNTRSVTLPLLVGIGVIVALLVLVGVLYVHSRPKTYLSGNQATKGEPPASSQTPTNQGGPAVGNEPGDNKNSSDNNTGNTPPATPSGDFVSNHHPNLNGSPSPNTIQSVCNTTSGASCRILFHNGDTTKSLPPQTTDRGGAAYWTWRLQDIGLTSGTWQVEAVATANGQSRSANDAMALVVAP